MITYTDFGLEIRQELLKKKKTIKWLAEQIGCSNAQLSEMLKGSRDLVTRENDWADKIKEVLNCDKTTRAAAD